MSKPMLIYMPKMQFFDPLTNQPLSGGQVFIYQPSTTTPLTTYTDATLATPNANPLILNSYGQPTTDMYVTQTFKMVATRSTDTNPPTNPIWTEDNITTLGQLVSTSYKNTNYITVVTDRDKLFLVDASSSPVTITLLPSVTAGDGFNLKFKKYDTSANVVTIQANGSETIDGSNTILLYNPNDYVEMINYQGTQWETGKSTPQIFRDANYNPVIKLITEPGAIDFITVANAAGGYISSATINSGGSGYSTPPTVSFSGGGGSGAAGTAILGYTVASINVTNSGSGYTSPPTVIFTGGGGSGAAGTAVLTSQQVTSVTISNNGSGYTSAPAISFTGGAGTGAAGTAVLASTGAVESITITNGGSNYSSVPTITFSGAGGANATAVVTPQNPTITADGTSTDIGLNFQTQGAGNYQFLATSAQAATLQLFEQSTNGITTVGLQAPASLATSYNLTLPSTVPTVGQGVRQGTTAGILINSSPVHFENIAVFTTSGTFTPPADVQTCYVECIGAGGGGDACQNSSINSGGGGGALAAGIVTVTPSVGVTVTIGAGGAGTAANSTAPASSGNNTSFGSLIVAVGGTGGGGGNTGATSLGGAGGAAGSCTGTILISGGHGNPGASVTGVLASSLGGQAPRYSPNPYGLYNASGPANSGTGGNGGNAGLGGGTGGSGLCIVYY